MKTIWHDATEIPVFDDREMIVFMVEDKNSIYHTKKFFVNLISILHLENWTDECHFSDILKWCLRLNSYFALSRVL